MAFLQSEVLYKLYAQGSLLRSNIANINEWASVDFNLNENKRLVSIDASLAPRTDNAGSLNGGLNAPMSPTWFWRGFALDAQRSFMRYSGKATLYNAPVLSPTRTFVANFTALQGSNFNPVVKPDCLFCGGFLMSEITAYFGADYTLGNSYWGRLYLLFTFEV